jgi:hypothetical protein
MIITTPRKMSAGYTHAGHPFFLIPKYKNKLPTKIM